MVRSVAAAVVGVLLGACGEPELRTVRIRRVEPGVAPLCGAPQDARQVIVTALGEFAVAPETATSFPVGEGAIVIDRFPEAARVVSVQVLGLGGEERVVGRTAEFAIGELRDEAELSVFMAPRRGGCPAGPLAQPRAGPLIARAGELVVVAGGVDSDGRPVPGADVFDPRLGRFEPLTGGVYGDESLGLVGASMTGLGAGRAVIAGGPRDAFQLFDAASRELEPPQFLDEPRAHHAAVMLADGRLFLAGGCAGLDADGACLAGTERADSSILDPRTGVLDPGPALAQARLGGAAMLESDGRVLLAGGTGADGSAVARLERLDPAGGPSESVDGVAGMAVRLASGAVLVGFGLGTAASAAWVIPPGATAPVSLTAGAGTRSGATLTALDDGSVLLAGGATDPADGELVLYTPFAAQFERLTASSQAPPRRDHAAIRLAGGGVLLVGGRDEDGSARADAWIYRHDLTARFTSEVAIDVGQTPQTLLLSPRSPADVVAERDAYRLRGAGERLGSYAVVGGPSFAAPRVSSRLALTGAGVAVVVAFESSSRLVYAALRPGAPPRLIAVDDGRERILCEAELALAATALAGARTVQLTVAPTVVVLGLDDSELLRCELAQPLAAGRVGVGALGGAETEVVVETLSATR